MKPPVAPPAVLVACQAYLARRPRLILGVVLAAIVSVPIFLFVIPPASFPERAYLRIAEGSSVASIATTLEAEGVIAHPLVFRALFRILGADDSLKHGSYLFAEPIGLAEVAYRLASGVSGINSVRVTIPEGYTSYQMARTFATALPRFDAAAFEVEAALEEGYLFPDTYEFLEDATEEEVRMRMRENFDTQIATIRDQIEASNRSLREVIIMASILEKEGVGEEDRRMIAGILWKRLSEGMALQVDAAFAYGERRETFHPSFADLEKESPYNTYKYAGLPPTAIASPGLVSLTAAVTPLSSEYWYYLTGTDGVMRYARTFEEHKENRRLYLD